MSLQAMNLMSHSTESFAKSEAGLLARFTLAAFLFVGVLLTGKVLILSRESDLLSSSNRWKPNIRC